MALDAVYQNSLLFSTQVDSLPLTLFYFTYFSHSYMFHLRLLFFVSCFFSIWELKLLILFSLHILRNVLKMWAIHTQIMYISTLLYYFIFHSFHNQHFSTFTALECVCVLLAKMQIKCWVFPLNRTLICHNIEHFCFSSLLHAITW